VRYTYLVKEKQSYTQKIRARYKNGVKKHSVSYSLYTFTYYIQLYTTFIVLVRLMNYDFRHEPPPLL